MSADPDKSLAVDERDHIVGPVLQENRVALHGPGVAAAWKRIATARVCELKTEQLFGINLGLGSQRGPVEQP